MSESAQIKFFSAVTILEPIPLQWLREKQGGLVVRSI